jgi:alanine racemase
MVLSRSSYVQVDLDAIARNVRLLKSRIPRATYLAAVVKADGYGHGAVAVAKAALAHGANWLCIATIAEGEALRAAGIRAPMLILSPSAVVEMAALIRNDLTPTIMDAATGAALGQVAARLGKAPYPVHVKVDTGMHRYGVPVAEAPALLEALRGVPGVRVEGVFTHFATADAVDDPFLRQQAETFAALIATLEDMDLRPRIVHAANSGATLQRVAPWDMVRAGIALYGLPPAPDFPADGLSPAMRVHSAVARVMDVPAGESIGYGRRFVARQAVRAALIPLGYADGLSRSLSDRGYVLIGGHRCRLAGNVSMDQCVALLPDGLDARVDDPVVVVGEQGGAAQTLTDLAIDAGTISYELAVRFGARLGRRYVGGAV